MIVYGTPKAFVLVALVIVLSVNRGSFVAELFGVLLAIAMLALLFFKLARANREAERRENEAMMRRLNDADQSHRTWREHDNG